MGAPAPDRRRLQEELLISSDGALRGQIYLAEDSFSAQQAYDWGLVAKVVPMLERELGKSNVEQVEPTMGAEDFGLFSQGGVPTFMFRLGTIPAAKIKSAKSSNETLPSLHSECICRSPR